MKILISAYACEPHEGSEPGVGWNWSLQAARHGNEVHVITRANNREVIESEMSRGDYPAGLRFHYLDLPRPFLGLKRRTGFFGLLVYYYLWQVSSTKLARRIHREVDFDIAHHVTFCNDWMPSGISFLGIPFVWGPIGGSTHRIPPSVELKLPSYARRHERIRQITQSTMKWLDPFGWLTRTRSAVILPFTEHAMAGVPAAFRSKARPIKHIGFDEEEIPAVQRRADTSQALVVMSGGRLVHWKGLDLLIEGFAVYLRATDARSTLKITGQGPYRPRLEALAADRGVTEQVRFLGRLPTRDDVYRLMAESDMYALPTLRDGPPVAILEAMSVGLPILCLDYGSTHELVPDHGGIKVAVESREQIVDEIAEALIWADHNRAELKEMGEAAAEYAREYHSWDRIGDEVQDLYDLVYKER